MKLFFTTILLLVSQFSFSQEKSEVLPLLTDVEKAQEQIVNLREGGALVVRLFLTKKKIELYRKFGNEKLANQLKEKLQLENSLITKAFADSTFSFCPVYFIDTKDYGRVINGEKNGFFLDKNLEIDASITMKEDFFFFVERGPVYDQVNTLSSFTSSETSSTPTVSDALVIKDVNMNQLVRPFPFFKKIYFADNRKTNIGFYIPNKNNSKGGVWYYTPPITIIEKLAIKDKKEEYISSLAVIEKKTGIPEKELSSFSKNIVTYYKNEYEFKKTELTLPFNIYGLNVKLFNFYYASIANIKRAEEKELDKQEKKH